MDINSINLRAAGVGFSAAFQRGLGAAQPIFERITTTVTSSTASSEYGWLGEIPGFREWIGDRVIQSIGNSSYELKNRSFESTVGVERENIEDDNLGIYGPLFETLGQSARMFPNTLVFALLKAAFTSKCYDGQYFFDTDHPVLDEKGNIISVANTDGGNGAPWFLMDVSRPLKPLIFQGRKAVHEPHPQGQAEDDNIFYLKEFVYGVGWPAASVGFGFWQMAWGLQADTRRRAPTKPLVSNT